MRNEKRNLFALLILLAGLAITSCRSEKTEEVQPNTLAVRIDTVRREQIRLPVHSIGHLRSTREVKLSFKTGGLIDRVYVNEGDRVNKGQILARLKMNEIEAAHMKAKLALEKAARDLERAQNLYRDSVATLEQYQNAQTAHQLAEQQLTIAAHNLRHSTILAPGDGLILMKLAEEGEIIAPGYPVLYFGLGREEWITTVSLTDKDVVHVDVGDSAIVLLDAWPDNLFEAEVSSISNMADPLSGTFELDLSLKEVGVHVKPGMIARADIFPRPSQDFLSIPLSALTEITGLQAAVWVLDEGKPRRAVCTVHHIENEKVFLSAGLEEGALVVCEGSGFVTAGAILTVKTD